MHWDTVSDLNYLRHGIRRTDTNVALQAQNYISPSRVFSAASTSSCIKQPPEAWKLHGMRLLEALLRTYEACGSEWWRTYVAATRDG